MFKVLDISAIVQTDTKVKYTKQMPVKISTEAIQVLKLDVKVSDHARLVQYGKDHKMPKREAASQILSEFLRRNVKLEVE